MIWSPRHIRRRPVWASVPEAIEEFRAGRPLVIVDSADRENEGDVCIPAQFVSDGHVNFMISHARGLVCLALAPERCDRLGLELMTSRNGTRHETAFTVSIEAAAGVDTGISAADRARTIQVAASADATAGDLVQPGHVFPLRARAGGVLARAGHTEASVELCELAGLEPAATICEIIKDDGTMARVPDLEHFCARHGLRMFSIESLIEWRRSQSLVIERCVTAHLPTRYGTFDVVAYRSAEDGAEHMALVKGAVDGREDVLVRVHSQCATGDVFGSLRCDCGQQLERALREIESEGAGVLVYLAQEGRGIGLVNKLRAYVLQEKGLDTVDANLRLGFQADLRRYDVAAAMLADLGVRSVRVLTNNPRKLRALAQLGVDVRERVVIEIAPGRDNLEYLRAKRERLGHLLSQALLDGGDESCRARRGNLSAV